jgi:hypothetical protein
MRDKAAALADPRPGDRWTLPTGTLRTINDVSCSFVEWSQTDGRKREIWVTLSTRKAFRRWAAGGRPAARF